MKNDLIYNGLNSFTYTDNNFWLEEAKTVFSDNWVFAGCKHKLINIGDILPIKVAGQPTVKVSGNKLNAQAKSALKRAKRGETVQIFDINAKISGNSSYKLPRITPVFVELAN